MTPRPLLAALLLALSVPAAAERLLILGDSHTVGPFGSSLDARLRQKGYDTALDAVCSASISWWLGPKRPKLSICYSLHDFGGANNPREGAPAERPPTAEELLKSNPDVVVFALGSNPDANSSIADAARTLLALLKPGTRCYWVGPPPMPDRLRAIAAVYRALPAVLEEAAQSGRSCELIDSRQYIHSSDAAANDHFYGAPAVEWGRRVAEKIAR